MKQVYESRKCIIFETDEGYIFKIYPLNNKNQEIGTSTTFENLECCKKAYDELERYVLNNSVDSVENSCISTEKVEDEKGIYKYRYVCKIGEENIFYQRYVYSLDNCTKGVKRLYDALKYIYK